MRSSIIATVFWFAWVIAACGEERQALLQAIADLSNDDFAKRERASQILWESGDEALITETARHGATTEARVRAAQVLSSYRWGIVPGVGEAVEHQIKLFRNGDLAARSRALSALMQMGALRAAGRCVLLVDGAVERQRLNAVMRALLGETVPRELVRGRREEVREFLATMAAAGPGTAPRTLRGRRIKAGGFLETTAVAGREYQRDLDALQFTGMSDEDFEKRIVPATPNEEARGRHQTPAGLLFQNLGELALTQLRGEEAAEFDIRQSQGRVADAVDALRSAIGAEAATSAADVIRAYLAREAANVKPQLYSKKALNLPNSSGYQPTGLKITDGFRHVISFCHAYGLTQLVAEAGDALASRLETESPAALPAFCAWAAHYSELRSRAIAAAKSARQAGVPGEFAYGPLADQLSRRGAWFGQFTTLREHRSLLESGVRNGGWGGLSDVDSAALPLAVRGQLAMATGDWKVAAEACAAAAENANTLASGAVLAFHASVAHARAGNPDIATKWRAIAEAIPLGNESARAALADAMHRFGDSKGAWRNRMQLLYQHHWEHWEGDDPVTTENAAFVHTLRLSVQTANLTKSAAARALVQWVLTALAREIAAAPESLTGLGEIVRDLAAFYQGEIIASIAAERWSGVIIHLQSAHRCAPGDVRPFEIVANIRNRLQPDALQTVTVLLNETAHFWEDAIGCFPDNARCARQLLHCRELQGELAAP